MRKIKEVLRLKWERGLSNRQVALACGISRPTVREYLRRFAEAGLSWPLPENLGESRLEQLLFPPPPDLPAHARVVPDWHRVKEELRGKHVTLFLIWQEYREAHPEGYQYSWFCENYRAWQGKLDMVMRQDHRAGEKLFVDYAGQTVPVIDRNPRAAEGYDHLVFDTAPTGHTLRLLSLPSAWTGYIETNTSGTSCLGPLEGLAAQKETYAGAVAALADGARTTLVLVSRP
ncbi:hypothetical protein CKO15_12260, partial [Halorhodospira abdelmalekii]|nr:hypothetical protein [Halorhodospira abdelmalekii]